MIPADPPDGFDAVGQLEFELEPFGTEARAAAFGVEDFLLRRRRQLARPVFGRPALFKETGDLAIKSFEPFAYGLDGGFKSAGGGLDPVLFGMKGHSQSQRSG